MESMVSDAVSSLNALERSCPGQGPRLECPRRIPQRELTGCQDAALSKIAKAAKLFLPHWPASDFVDGPLAQILRSRTVYDSEEDSTVAQYSPSKLKVLEGRTQPKDARGLVGEFAGGYLDKPGENIELSPEEAKDVDPTEPHWDPEFRQQGGARMGVHQAAHACWAHRVLASEERADWSFLRQKEEW